jgi:hypothetical protein
MGGKVSSLKYYQIIQIIDLVSKKDTNKFMHIIKYYNGKEEVIKLNKNQEHQFQLRYKYSRMFKDISKIRYSKITNIIKTNIDDNIDKNKYNLLNKYVLDEEDIYIYNLKLILDDGTVQILHFNKTQYDLFCKIYYDINKTKV